MNEKMDAALSRAVGADETILWRSATQPFGILDGKEGKATLRRWVLCALCLLVLGALYAANNGAGVGFFFALLAFLAIIVFSSLFQYRLTRDQYYCITDRRVMIVRNDGDVFDMPLSDAEGLRLYPLDIGGAAVAIGSPLLKEGDKQLCWRSGHPFRSAEAEDFNTIRGMVLYRVDEPERAMSLLGAGTAVSA